MKCPFCGNLDDRVINSRVTKGGDTVRRRRKCLYCNNRFTTYETIKEILMVVTKKDGRQEPFDRNKIKAGICRARKKLDISATTIEKIVKDLEFELKTTGKKKFLSSNIGEKVMLKLHKLNDIAYVRFASVYREFKYLEDFVIEVKNLLGEK